MTQLEQQQAEATAQEQPILDRDALASIAVEAASAMFGLALYPGDDAADVGETQGDRHVVMLRLHGVPPVFLSLACAHDAGAEIASVIFEVDQAHADGGMIDDSLRELANIFAGQIKSMVAPDHEIGLPRMQKDLTALRSHEWQGVSLRIGAGQQTLNVALAA